MKHLPALSALICLGFTACDTMNQPMSSGDFDPLRPPGSGNNLTRSVGPGFKAGQFVRAAMNNTAFFKVRPKTEAEADKLLPIGTSMKVIATADSYLKVELDTGEVGFVLVVMVEDPNAAPATTTMNPGEYQVYPPVGGYGEPLPPVPPAEMPPEGAIPTVIDPEAPGVNVPVPPVPPPTAETFPAPPAEQPNTAPAPLPPNGEEGQ